MEDAEVKFVAKLLLEKDAWFGYVLGALDSLVNAGVGFDAKAFDELDNVLVGFVTETFEEVVAYFVGKFAEDIVDDCVTETLEETELDVAAAFDELVEDGVVGFLTKA